MELITKLGIDWKLLLAQIVNFLILLAILRAFAYKPVLQMLERRRKMIEKGVTDAKKSEELLHEIEQTKAKAIDQMQERSLLMKERAAKEAEIVRQSILESARMEAAGIVEKAKREIMQEKEKMMAEARRELALLAINAAEKVIDRAFSAEDQKRFMDETLIALKE